MRFFPSALALLVAICGLASSPHDRSPFFAEGYAIVSVEETKSNVSDSSKPDDCFDVRSTRFDDAAKDSGENETVPNVENRENDEWSLQETGSGEEIQTTFGRTSKLLNRFGSVFLKGKGAYEFPSSNADSLFVNFNFMGTYQVVDTPTSGRSLYYGCDSNKISKPPTVTKADFHIFVDASNSERRKRSSVLSASRPVKVFDSNTNASFFYKDFGESYPLDVSFLPSSFDLVKAARNNLGSLGRSFSNALDLCRFALEISQTEGTGALLFSVTGEIVVGIEKAHGTFFKKHSFETIGRTNGKISLKDELRTKCPREYGEDRGRYFCYFVEGAPLAISGCEDLLKEYNVTFIEDASRPNNEEKDNEPSENEEKKPDPPKGEKEGNATSNHTSFEEDEEREESVEGETYGRNLRLILKKISSGKYKTAVILLVAAAWIVIAGIVVCIFRKASLCCCNCLKDESKKGEIYSIRSEHERCDDEVTSTIADKRGDFYSSSPFEGRFYDAPWITDEEEEKKKA